MELKIPLTIFQNDIATIITIGLKCIIFLLDYYFYFFIE